MDGSWPNPLFPNFPKGAAAALAAVPVGLADQVRHDLKVSGMEHSVSLEAMLVSRSYGITLKQGQKSLGVKRQYSGTVQVENCQIASYSWPRQLRGAAFLVREPTYPSRNGVRTASAAASSGSRCAGSAGWPSAPEELTGPCPFGPR